MAIVALILWTGSALAFTANISGSPNPNTGDYTVSWSNPTYLTYYLEENPGGTGSWTTVWAGTGSSFGFTGKTPNDYWYRLRYRKRVCTGWPEPTCYWTTTYSEPTVVTVNAPSGGEDPYPPPGAFTPPSSADFPDATIINPGDPGGDNNVGALNGSGGVSGGQASYSIPIVVPPGRKGMQPSVSLNYSSSSGNGVVGVGWGLSATSAISRCSATVAQDGFTAGVQYSASRDRLCLDGQRLMVVSGTYGVNGAEYRTELDVFARIRQYGGGINSTSTYFIVEYKNGHKSWFGNVSSARFVAAGKSQTMTWAVRETRDASGNNLVFDYTNFGNGEYNVAAIHYTGHNGTSGDRHVRFEYEPRPDVRSYYTAGGKTRSTKRLKKIKTEYQSTLIREYTLDYGTTTSASSGRSLLRGVEECAWKADVKNCLPATDFEWQEHTPQYGDASGDGERLYHYDGSSKVYMLTDKRWLHDVIPNGDVNGDGVKDWPGLFLNAEGQKVSDVGSPVLANCFKPLTSVYLKCLQVDFNNDGITDSFRENNDKFEVKRTPTSGSSSWITTGIDWDPSGVGLADFPLGFADFNGDGWTDVAFVQNDKLWVYFHTKNTSAPYLSTLRQLVFTYSVSAGLSREQELQITGDMDGNGTPDFVVASVNLPNEAPGLPKPTVILLTESGSGGSMSITSRPITNLIESQFTSSHFFHDLNGDGLMDLLALEDGLSGDLQYRLNNGVDFEMPWKDLNVGVPIRGGNWFNSSTSEWSPYRMPVMSKVLTIDYDNDGRDDLLVAGDAVASGCAFIASVGTGGSWLCDDDLYGEFQANVTSHVGTPINAAIADDSIRQYWAIIFSEDAAGNITATETATNIEASASQTAVIDATGDGLPDIVTVFGCRGPEPEGCLFNDQTSGMGGTVNLDYLTEGAWIYRNTGVATDIPTNYEFEYGAHDMMSAAEDAFGNRHEWVYRPLSSDKYNRSSTWEYYQTEHDDVTATDYFHFASSMYVVAEQRASNGIGDLNSTLYRYRGAIFNNQGRGFQGFLAIETEQDVYASTDPLADRDIISRTEFHQMWPKSSIVDKACSWLATDYISAANPTCDNIGAATKLLSHTETDLIHDVATTGGARFVAVDTQTVKGYDLASRDLLTTKVTDISYDAYGNATLESQSHSDAWTANSSQTARVFAAPDLTNWWLNKLNSESVTHNPVSFRHASTPTVVAAQDQTKVLTTTYNSYNATHRLPTQITTTANDSSLSLVVDTNYNSYGLPNWIETDGTDVTGPRRTTMTYTKSGSTAESDGYFPYTVENALGHVTTQTTDPAHGVPLTQTDPNGLVSSTVHDAFGRVSESTPAGSPTTYYRYHWCDGVPSCTSNAEYRLYTLAAGQASSLTYVDKLGRAEYIYWRNFGNNGWVLSRTQFDARGNKSYIHRPWDPLKGESSNKGERFTSYDALGRVTSKEVDQANGQVLTTTYTHVGFTTAIDAGGIDMERTYNGLGQLMETKDGDGNYTRYAYDGAGNPIVMADPKMLSMPNVVGILASFNAFGHKEWVEDPDWWDDIAGDHGYKTFSYNALGEVLSELDPNGNLIEMVYDELGRMTDRKVNGELDGKWHYDNTDTYKGLGLLDFEDSQFRDDGSRLQKFYYYSSAASGRKDLLQVTHRLYENGDQFDFDEYPVQHFADGFYARPKGLRYPGGTGVLYEYNSTGHLIREKDPSSAVIYREVTDIDTHGQISAANVGYHGAWKYNVAASFYDATGQAESIAVTAGGSPLQTLNYTYDNFGNLSTRSTSVGPGNTEIFTHDNLQRLTSSYRSAGGTVSYTHDSAGSFLTKSDYASLYTYNANRPHVLNQVNLVGGGSVVFAHDQNGNITQGHGETISYNAFNKPEHIYSGTTHSYFSYGADLMRYRQETPSGSVILYIDKLMEIETLGGSVDYRHYLGDVAILTKTGSLNDPSPSIKYLFRDRLGSVAMVADQYAVNFEYRGYDAYGKPRNGNWSNKTPPVINSTVTDRGFTDHEHLDDWQLIHMNGRGYDYNLGRFLSVDPFIQDPGNSQAINGYSYIGNNPLSGTDPTGYCATSDRATSCADSIENGSTTSITNDDGDVVGYAGKDSEGNFYVTNNGTRGGTSAIQNAIGFVENGGLDEIGAPRATAGENRILGAGQSDGEDTPLTANTSLGLGAKEKKKGSTGAPVPVYPEVDRSKQFVTIGDALEALEAKIFSANQAGNRRDEYGGLVVEELVERDFELLSFSFRVPVAYYYTSDVVTSGKIDSIDWHNPTLRAINLSTPIIAIHHYHPLSGGGQARTFSERDRYAFNYWSGPVGFTKLRGIYMFDKYGTRVYDGSTRKLSGKKCSQGIKSCW